MLLRATTSTARAHCTNVRLGLARADPPSACSVDSSFVDRDPTVDLGRTDPPSVDNSFVDRDPTVDLGRTN